jgi:hypothetical protein
MSLENLFRGKVITTTPKGNLCGAEAKKRSEDKEVKDHFEPGENPCDRCRWVGEVSDRDFPCSHCIHNQNHL